MIPIRFKRKTTKGENNRRAGKSNPVSGKLVGALTWKCVRCGCEVMAEQRGEMPEDYRKFVSAIFDAKLCSVCHKAAIKCQLIEAEEIAAEKIEKNI